MAVFNRPKTNKPTAPKSASLLPNPLSKNSARGTSASAKSLPAERAKFVKLATSRSKVS